MSELVLTACDGCGQHAPDQMVGQFPKGDWVHINTGTSRAEYDACCWDCLATVVAERINALREG